MSRTPLSPRVTMLLKNSRQALDCRLVYAFVPRESLDSAVRQRAERIAAAIVDSVAHTMRLEAQGEEIGDRQRQIAEEVEEILRRRPGELWEESR